MNKESSGIMEIRLQDLVPFSIQSSQTYQGERLAQLMDSIERVGLMHPIIVRPADDEKYEIICGHNRVKAMKELGRDMIQAEVRTGLSDDEAMELFYESNLNQQSFSDWSYSQKIEAVKYSERLIRESSHQGRRTDLEQKKSEAAGEGTSVYPGQMLFTMGRRKNTRDRMACRLGISTATLSKYRSIIKLLDDLIESLGRLLDQKKISFEVAYLMSRLERDKFEWLVGMIDERPYQEVDKGRLKEYCERRKDPKYSLQVLPADSVGVVLKDRPGSGIIIPVEGKTI